ncbi:MAG TPA: hypothetical protein VET27_10125 [Mycobacterium sp.]|nr:hypothetical protein [Mycobacterium sp.]
MDRTRGVGRLKPLSTQCVPCSPLQRRGPNEAKARLARGTLPLAKEFAEVIVGATNTQNPQGIVYVGGSDHLMTA